MKGIITSLIACVIFFVAFGISVGVLGINSEAVAVRYYEEPDYTMESASIISGNTVKSDEWKINHDFCELKIDSSGIRTVVTGTERDNIYISLSNPNHRNVYINVFHEKGSESGAGCLNLTVSPASGSGFHGILSGFTSWFSGNYSNVTLDIELPMKMYSSLEVYQGSGSISLKEVYAKENTVNVGSGTFSLTNDDPGKTAGSFEFTLGSGSANISGLNTEQYDLTIGSGSYYIEGLTGSGKIDQGSGRGSVFFGNNGSGTCDVDIGSGSISFYLPDEMSAAVKCDIGSGCVDIFAGGTEKTIRSRNDYEEVNIGSGAHDFKFNIDMGSGYVSIQDQSPDTAFTEITYSSYPSEEFGYSVSVEEAKVISGEFANIGVEEAEAIDSEFAHIGEVMIVE